MHLEGIRKKRISRASVYATSLVVVLFIVFLTVSFVPWVNSRTMKIQLGHESPFSSLLGTSSASQPYASTAVTSKVPNGSMFFYVGASTSLPSVGGNLGVRSLVQVKSQNASGGVLSFWISEAMSNNMWAQAGYYIDDGSAPIAFYQIWNLTNRLEVSTGTEHVSQGMHLFSIVAVAGTESWNFSMDGKTFGAFDMGSNVSSATYPIYAMSEEGYTHAPFSFEPVLFQSAIQVLRSGEWSNASSASSYGSDWGLEGHSQNSMLGNNEFQVGPGCGQLASDSELWI